MIHAAVIAAQIPVELPRECGPKQTDAGNHGRCRATTASRLPPVHRRLRQRAQQDGVRAAILSPSRRTSASDTHGRCCCLCCCPVWPRYRYRGVLFSSSLTLAPRGLPNHPESFRVYEALEMGSIPVIERDDYWAGLLGADHPLPTVDVWPQLPELVRGMDLDATQARCRAWWRDYKGALSQAIGRLMAGRLGGQRGSQRLEL